MSGYRTKSTTVFINVTGNNHQEASFSLSGEWQISRSDEISRRSAGDLGLNDSGWSKATVPGQWRDTPEVADADAVLYRKHFSCPLSGRETRRWLVFDGLCYQGDIWLDGSYLGDTEGYFAPHVFDISEHLAARDSHVLAVEATCTKISDEDEKSNITGVLQHWDQATQGLNPGGIWRDVRVEQTGAVRLQELKVLVLEADTDRAIIRCSAKLDSAGTHSAMVKTTASKANTGQLSASHEQTVILATASNEIEWHIAIEEPELWWPHSMGLQPLYDINVDIEIDGVSSHEQTRRVGIRTFQLTNWIATINGERLFLKGANLGPASIHFAEISSEDHRRDLMLARDAHLDLIRIHGHIPSPDLYNEADELGMLLWQDFPLQWGHARGIRNQAMQQATSLVNNFGHHPSIVIWSAHNEPSKPIRGHQAIENATYTRFGSMTDPVQQLPSWNRSILDRGIKQALKEVDPTRPVVAHSGVLPNISNLKGTDSHLYFGWQHGEVSNLEALASKFPRLVEFVSEFGAQAVPQNLEIAEAAGAEHFPNINTEILQNTYGAELQLLIRTSPLNQFSTWDLWVTATQLRQAEIIRHTVEILRTLKYRPTGGYCQFMLADAMPYVSYAVLDDRRRPKLGWRALQTASKPVIVVADLHSSSLELGSHTCEIHVVSDLREKITSAIVTVTWECWGSDPIEWVFKGNFEADSVTRIASLTLPAVNQGVGNLKVSLKAPQIEVSNTYSVTIR
ncbi:MAG: beta-mannosidase [Candidatus Poriferisodalaceae bacterium]